MRAYSEIKWSEFVRKIIQQRIAELEKLEKTKNKEGILTMLASEDVLKKDWINKNDDRWNKI